MSINITVTGRLTKAPELRRTKAGKQVTSFDLAHNFRERSGSTINDVATIFFSATVWAENGAAEVAELGLTKGSRVTVEGLWSKRTWITKDKQRRISDVLVVSKVRLYTETEISSPDDTVDVGESTSDEDTPPPAKPRRLRRSKEAA